MSRRTQGAHAQSTDVPVADDAALSLRGFGVTFAGSDTPASTGIDLDLRPGRVQALVGESGSGKSVTALGALGLLPPTATVTGSARVIDPGAARKAGRDDGESGTADAVELVGASRPVLDDVRGRLVGTIFQEPTTALDPLETIAFQIGEAVRAHPDAFRRAHASAGSDAGSQAGGGGRRRPGLPGRSGRSGRLSRAEVDARVRELLARVGLGGRGTGGKDSADTANSADGEVLERIARSYPHQLSGGQLQRACIALAMACDPPVLIADEPTTALDVTVQAGILDLLRSLTQDEGVAVLLITHDMAVVADVADDVAVMRHGRIVERDAVREIFRKPRHEYTRELLAAVPRLDSLRQEDPFAAVARESEAPAKGAAEPVVAVTPIPMAPNTATGRARIGTSPSGRRASSSPSNRMPATRTVQPMIAHQAKTPTPAPFRAGPSTSDTWILPRRPVRQVGVGMGRTTQLDSGAAGARQPTGVLQGLRSRGPGRRRRDGCRSRGVGGNGHGLLHSRIGPLLRAGRGGGAGGPTCAGCAARAGCASHGRCLPVGSDGVGGDGTGGRHCRGLLGLLGGGQDGRPRRVGDGMACAPGGLGRGLGPSLGREESVAGRRRRAGGRGRDRNGRRG